jgi:hypothetical protein
MTTKIGLAGNPKTVPDPHRPEYTVALATVAGSARALDGTLNSLFVAAKRRWYVEWRLLSATDFDTLWAELVRLAHLSWQPPEGSTYTVRVQNASWQETSAGRYMVIADLEEV